MVISTNVDERIQAAVHQLAAERPANQIALADVARLTGVHWTTVRRHVGGKDGLRALVERAQPATDSLDTRSRILTAAARIFGERGFAGASLDEIASSADLTKGAVYWHFASKSDLFLTLVEANTRKQLATWPATAAGALQGPDPVAALGAWLAGSFGDCMADPSQARLYMEFLASSREEPVQVRLASVHRAARLGATEAIRDLQAQGLIHPRLNPEVLALFVQGLLNGLLLEWLVDAEAVRLTEWAPDLAAILWTGAKPTDV